MNKQKKFLGLEVEIENNSWGAGAKRTEAQIGAHYFWSKKVVIHGKSRKALAQEVFHGELGAFLDDSCSDAEP